MEGVRKSKRHGCAGTMCNAACARPEARHTVFGSGIMIHIGWQRKGLYELGIGEWGKDTRRENEKGVNE